MFCLRFPPVSTSLAVTFWVLKWALQRSTQAHPVTEAGQAQVGEGLLRTTKLKHSINELPGDTQMLTT